MTAVKSFSFWGFLTKSAAKSASVLLLFLLRGRRYPLLLLLLEGLDQPLLRLQGRIWMSTRSRYQSGNRPHLWKRRRVPRVLHRVLSLALRHAPEIGRDAEHLKRVKQIDLVVPDMMSTSEGGRGVMEKRT